MSTLDQPNSTRNRAKDLEALAHRVGFSNLGSIFRDLAMGNPVSLSDAQRKAFADAAMAMRGGGQ